MDRLEDVLKNERKITKRRKNRSSISNDDLAFIHGNVCMKTFYHNFSHRTHLFDPMKFTEHLIFDIFRKFDGTE